MLRRHDVQTSGCDIHTKTIVLAVGEFLFATSDVATNGSEDRTRFLRFAKKTLPDDRRLRVQLSVGRIRSTCRLTHDFISS